MRYFERNWAELIACAEAWQALPGELRARLLALRPEALEPAEDFGEHVESLIEQGFLERAADPLLVRQHPDRVDSFALLRGLARIQHLGREHLEEAEDYLRENLMAVECEALLRGRGGSSPARYWAKLAALVTSRVHLQSLLDSENLAEWERERMPDHLPWKSDHPPAPLLATAQSAADCLALLRDLIRHGGPVDLLELEGHEDRERLGAAILAALRYALVFPSLDAESGALQIELWPSVALQMNREARPLPPPREASDFYYCFDRPWGFEDLTHLLRACREPVRLRSNGEDLHLSEQRELEAVMAALPLSTLVSEEFARASEARHAASSVVSLDIATRLRLARRTATCLGWTEVCGKPGKDLALTLTDLGREWLARPAAERMREMIDSLLPELRESRAKPDPHCTHSFALRHLYDPIGEEIIPFEPYLPARTLFHVDVERYELHLDAREACAPLGEGPRSLEALLLRWQRAGLPESILVRWARHEILDVTNYIADEDWEPDWLDSLHVFLDQRLWRFGGLRIFVDEEGEAFAELTDVGRYLLRQTEVFDAVVAEP